MDVRWDDLRAAKKVLTLVAVWAGWMAVLRAAPRAAIVYKHREME